MKAEELRVLAALAEARKARDLARLEALAAEARGLAAEVAELAGTERRDMAEAAAPLAVLGKRAAWAAAEIAARRQRMVAITVEIAEARGAARVSLGKHEALALLAGRAERQERAARERAEELAAVANPRPGA